ncbi:MAG: hypothetical protein IPF42_19055 [Candidatus Microthrix sp.]|nr:hypothetical protein [Candidatus Microthrix sp.]
MAQAKVGAGPKPQVLPGLEQLDEGAVVTRRAAAPKPALSSPGRSNPALSSPARSNPARSSPARSASRCSAVEPLSTTIRRSSSV